MKLLGVFAGGLPEAYKELFAKEGIVFSEKVIENTLVNVGRTHTPSQFEVFVSEEDHDRAISAIRFYEKEMEQKVLLDGKAADQTMLKIFLVVLIVFGLFVIYLGYQSGWW